jgi:filamentous hemagglutinin
MTLKRAEYRTSPTRPYALPTLKPLAACIRSALAGAVMGASGGVAGGELPIPKATFATLGRADHAIVGNTLKIRQQTDRSILNWQSFNVGKDNAVRFVQPSASAIALNRISQADPSRILGKVTANGQIYLINQNGFVFGKNSSINANSLVASTLDITDDTFERGLTKVIDQDGRAALTGTGEVYRKGPDGQYLVGPDGSRLKAGIDIEQGAAIAVAKNGRLILAAPAIANKGDLSAPEGQIIMAAAGDRVYLQEAGADSKLRGLLVEVGSGGEVANLGRLLAKHGNVTLVGFAVNQSGRVSATTSVSSAGSVRLLAREGAATRRDGEGWALEPGSTQRSADRGDGLGSDATLVLGQGSVTEATPDLDDPSKAVDGQTQDKSWIEAMGRKVYLRSGSTLRSKSGDVTVTATENPANPGQPGPPGVQNQSRIYLDEGAVIDVSGVKNVSVPMERNVVEVELRSNELRDSPLQRNGVLYAQKVRVDIRKGTPVADILGALERIERTVAERSTAGGTLKLVSEGDAIVRRGSLLDFSGGWVSYRSGFIDTTQLVSQGKLYDIGDADPNRIYDSVMGQVQKTFEKWRITRSWDIPGSTQVGRVEEGYIDGKPAGSLAIQANSLSLDGELRGSANRGAYQREADSRPAGGQLTIDLTHGRAPDSNSTQGVIFQTRRADLPLGPDDAFPRDSDQPQDAAPLVLAPDIFRRSGVMTADLRTAGKVHIRAGERIDVEQGGSLSLTGGEMRVDGAIAAPSGNVALRTRVPTGLADNRLSGAIELAAGAGIDARGTWSNERPGRNSDPDLSPVFIDGGSVAVTAQGDVSLAAGSRIAVDGAGRRLASGKVVAGNAGSIALAAANDLAGQGSSLAVDGELSGYALNGGNPGTLSLASSRVIIGEGGGPAAPGGNQPQPLILTPEFFRRGGFGRYTIESNKEGLTVREGTRITLSVPNRVLDGAAADRLTGSDIREFSHIEWLPEISRPAGEIALTLAQRVGQGTADAAVTIERGAAIATDAGGKVSLTSDTSVVVNGAIDAPAGEVALKVTTPVGVSDPGFVAGQGIWIGAEASLSAAGKALVGADRIGQRVGEVESGGRVALEADRGFVVMNPGAKIDVSGTAAELDLPGRTQLGAVQAVPRTVPSDGGTIAVRAAEGIVLEGSLSARKGNGAGAAGGTLTVELDPRTRAEPPELAPDQTPFPRPDLYPSVIEVGSSAGAASGLQPGAAVPAERFGRAVLSGALLNGGGFASLKLRTPDRIEFAGDLSLAAERSIELDAPGLVVPAGQGSVAIESSYVALGSTQTRPDDTNLRPGVVTTPAAGQAGFEVRADLVDLFGMATLSGVGRTHLYSAGDIRLIGVRTNQQQRDFVGQLSTAGNLDLQAQQVYPTTLSQYRVAVDNNSGGILSILPSAGEPGPVLSAAGKLSVEASTILHRGTLKVPQGELTLLADDTLWLAPGSLTSNSLEGAIVPFGRTQGGLDWLYPLSGQNLVYAPRPQNDTLPPPEKKMSLSARNIQLATGSVVDTSGGGDLYAFEFVPGPGGSVDILDSQDPKFLDGSFTYRPAFAVIPNFGSGYAPYDPLEYPTSGLAVGDRVYLSGGGGLKAGTYTLLPAHYALLPGAFLVTPEPGTTDLLPGQTTRALNGDLVVAGYRTVAGTGIRDARWSGFSIERQAVVRSRAEYSESYANRFFTERAEQQDKAVPTLPRDAGQIRLSADSGLALEGRVAAEPGQGGRGGRLDIEAANLAILAQAYADQPVVGAVNLLAEDLDRLGVASITLGGVRDPEDGYTELVTRASTVTIGKGAELKGPEFILTAKDSITLQEGAKITATAGETGDPAAEPTERDNFHLDGDSAFLRVSSGAQADFSRRNVDGKAGSIRIRPDATLAADGSIILDSTLDTELQGSIQMDGGAIALGASRIGLGQVTGASGGLVLSSEVLQTLKVDELALNSRSSLDLYPGVDLNLQSLTVRAAGILGFDGAGQTARIRADGIRFENPGSAASTAQAEGAGAVEFAARRIEFGAGDYRFQGFSRVDFTASEQIFGSGTGNLGFAADVGLTAPVFSAGQGGNTVIDATGHSVAIDGGGAVPAGIEANLGARLAVIGDRVTDAGRIRLPAGGIELSSLADDLVVRDGAELDVSGREVRFGSSALATDGGRVELSSATGDVVLQAGATLNLRGNRGGTLAVSAPEGRWRHDGQVDAHGTAAAGSFELDVGSLDGGSLGGIGAQLQAAGFGGALRIHTHRGDLALGAGDALAGRSIDLAADQGSITVQGSLTASGEDAELRVSAGDELRLGSAARLAAHGRADAPGKVLLEATDGGGLVVEPGAAIDVAAADGAANGAVRFRAARTGTDVALTGSLRGVVGGAAEITVEAVESYNHEGVITADDITGWQADTAAFMDNAEAVEARLGLPGGLRPGVQVRSAGDLVLGTAGWDLLDWRYGDRPGILTLAAAGDLTLDGTLSDGFRAYDEQGIDLSDLGGAGASLPVKDLLQPGDSWSYRLEAGRDVVVGSGAMVRTGTGDIAVAAGRDFVLADAGSALYTAGRPADSGRYGSFKNAFLAYTFYGEYPVDGGDIAIAAGRDVQGAVTGQFFDGWLVRTGNWSRNATHEGETPTSWAVALGRPDILGDGEPLAEGIFAQNVGALGGGNVTVRAGRDVTDLSVMLPTTGKQVGRQSQPDIADNTDFDTNQVAVAGGGNLAVSAGGDVVGGTFYVARGTGTISASGSIEGSGSLAGTGPILALGDGQYRLRAGGDVVLGAAFNPTVIQSLQNTNFFFTYSEASAVSLTALSGDIEVQNDLTGLVGAVNELRAADNQLNFNATTLSALQIYPGSFDAAALEGNISLDRTFVTYPAAAGRLELLAGRSIVTGEFGSNVNVTMSDADPSLLPSVDYPAAENFDDAAQRLDPFGRADLTHAKVPIHAGDAEPVKLYAQDGGILPRDPLLFSLAKQVEIHASGAMRDVSLNVQHPDYAVSSIELGGDLSFTSPRNAQGNLINLTRQIQLSGPGQLWVQAGGDIDLGASNGIVTLGNTFNSALADQGASISIFTGMKTAADFDGFAKIYDPASERYRAELTDYLRKRLGDETLDEASAPAAYAALPESSRREFLLGLFFGELRAAATAAALSGLKPDYDPGFAAIEALFPGQDARDPTKYQGDLKLFFSTIKTVDGGDINLLVPGGLVNAGLAASFAGEKSPSELGIVVQGAGALSAFVDGDFAVNQSRVFAMGGGDITIWSSNGDIDAGRGAKAALAVPPPIVSFDEQGNLQIIFPPAVSGSGIRTASSSPKDPPGNVILAAPRGVVDAGEAGIGGNNIVIAATAVIGASNIDVGGTATGVPTANVTVPVGAEGAAAAAAGAAQTAQQTVAASNGDKAAPSQDMSKSSGLNPLNVEVIGFGECSMSDIREGKAGCG